MKTSNVECNTQKQSIEVVLSPLSITILKLGD